MPEPRWMRDMDLAQYRARHGAELAAMWAAWALMKLPSKERSKAFRLWRQGKMPVEMNEEYPVDADRPNR